MLSKKKCKISNGYLAKQLKQGKSVGSAMLIRIKNTYPEINLNWVLTGNGKIVKITKN